MTGDLILDLAISVAGIIILVAISFLFGAMRTADVTQRSASERLSFDEPDFDPAEWFVGTDAKAAAAVSADGRETALVFAVGDGLATRRLGRASVDIQRAGAVVSFRLGEPSLSTLRLVAPDETTAEQWVLRLATRPL